MRRQLPPRDEPPDGVPYNVLLVEDNADHADLAREFLKAAGPFKLSWVDSLAALRPALEGTTFDVILMDYGLPDGSGLEALDELTRRAVDIPVVMVTGRGDEKIAAQAIQRGALDYLVKEGDYFLSLPAVIHKAVRTHALQRSAQRSLQQISYQALLLNNVQDAIVVWDADGLIQYWNPAAEALFGLGASECLGRPVQEVYGPLVGRLSPEAFAEGESERECACRDGRRLWLSSHLVWLQSEAQSGERLGGMDVVRDITPRKAAEQALRLSEGRLRAMHAAIPDSMLVLDPQGAVLEAEIKGDFQRRVWKGGARESFLARLREAAAHCWTAQQPSTVELTVEMPGTTLHLEVRLVIAGENRLLAMVRDITERKALEAQLQSVQVDRLRTTRLAAIGELAAGVAHQISNPLTTVIGECQLLLQSLDAAHPGRESAAAIEQAGWRAQDAVQQLMDSSRPESDRSEPVLLAQTVDRALALVGEKMRLAHVELDVRLDRSLPPLLGRPRQLEDLWLNLLLLAWDATAGGAGGRVRTELRAGDGCWQIVSVHDNGRPIPASCLDHIFEPSFTGSPYGRGTGLEPSLCREIVRRHGGTITVESSPETGTTFTVGLPCEGEG